MNNKKTIAELKKRIKEKSAELIDLQEEILLPKKMISASLIERYLGTKAHKRKSPAFYLSFCQKGKTKLKHVSKSKLKEVRAQCAQWRKYQQALRRWHRLSEQVWQDFKQLGKVQDQLGIK